MLDSRQISPKYRCPRTHAPLRLAGDALESADGTVQYPVKAGVPQLLHFESAEDADTRSMLARMNEMARTSGWEPALRATYSSDTQLLRYVTEGGRSSFVDLLPLDGNSDVLELGPGLGQFTAILAKRARSVCALEVVAGQAEFAAERCRQMGAANVFLAAGGDDCRLPYADQSFDVVVINLVFEWCASRCVDEPITTVQRRLLAEASRVLRPGGSMYLATKNRYALRLLLGKRDEHCYGVRFGSALPRWLAAFLVRRKGHARQFGMLYSHGALREMVRAAGFDEIKSFWATPEMRYPAHYVPTDAESIRKARAMPGFVQGEFRSTRMLMRFIPAPLVRHFTPGLAFLATKRK